MSQLKPRERQLERTVLMSTIRLREQLCGGGDSIKRWPGAGSTAGKAVKGVDPTAQGRSLIGDPRV
jgi:hypothetical protein